MLAILLKASAKDDIYHAGSFFYAGLICSIVALAYATAIFALRRKKKPYRFSYGFWLILGSGVAMIALAFLLDVMNPTVEVGSLE